ncbi:MAG: hypothetical protein CVV17_06415, partial [Gammaproteobacteria bacterium HGW-Gammaproteobacteria-7]
MSRSEQIRNVALVGHAGAGKTTLFEALLHAGGTVKSAGSVERGNTVSDSDPMEKTRGHSINSAVASIDHGADPNERVHVNLIDTPGYPDFRGPTLSALAAVETCAVVVNATAGIEHSTQRLMDYARARRLARVLIVNRIDDDQADLALLVEQLRDAFGPECLPINLPAKGRQTVMDCFFRPDGEADFSSVADAHQRILDQVVEVDEEVMGRYLEEGEQGLSAQELHDSFEQCLRDGHLVPICFVSARTGVGVTALLDLIDVGSEFCGRATDRTVWCWPTAEFGTVAASQRSTMPFAEVRGVAFQSFTILPEGFACGLADDGAAWCWGNNAIGGLGDGTTTSRSTPAPVLSDERFVSLRAGTAGVCARTAAGANWCWGEGVHASLTTVPTIFAPAGSAGRVIQPGFNMVYGL